MRLRTRSVHESQWRTSTSPTFLSVKTILLCVLAVCVFTPSLSQAGGGPENVFLVVNKRSWASRTIATHYIALRNIPSNNVFFIDWAGNVERINMATFQKSILKPILAEIDKRRLGDQIDYIVYSSDFPYEINFSKEVGGQGKFMSGSITSLTYLYELIEEGNFKQLGVLNNFYASTEPSRGSSRGFRNRDAWKSMSVKSVDGDGTNYFLSAMLGYTSGRGNSVDEIVDYLTKAAGADGTRPRGSVYFVNNQDIRSTTRSPLFPRIISAIKAEGGKAELLQGTLPDGKTDVIGATIGRANYNVGASKCKFLPGAILDNLTSFGGVLREGAGQTPLTEALRNGAAGATGTVIEPYALIPKFPHPIVHLHYLRGCNLAESVYQSVSAPYQLLLVGDPLCQPYAVAPIVECDGISSNQDISGEVTIRPRSIGSSVLRFELYVDGIRRGTCRQHGTLSFDSATMADGNHEIRIVAVANDDVGTQGRKIYNVTLNNHGNTTQARLISSASVSLNGKISVDIESSKSKRGFVLFSQREFLGSSKKKRATLTLSPLRLGMGPHKLLAVGLGESNLQNSFAAPIRVDVEPGFLFLSQPSTVGTNSTPGIKVRAANGITKSVESTKGGAWLTNAGVTDNQPFRIDSQFSVPKTGVYQFQMQFKGDFDLKVDGRSLFDQKSVPSYSRFEIPIHLERGGHRVAINARLSPPRMMLRFGDKGTQNLAGPRFHH